MLKIRVLIGLILLFLGAASGISQQPSRDVYPEAQVPWVVSVIHRIDLVKLLNSIRQDSKAQVGIIGTGASNIVNITTGLIIDGDGHVVTRLNHLDPRDFQQDITVANNEGISMPAKFIGMDCATGFTIIKVEGLKIQAPAFSSGLDLKDGLHVKVISLAVEQHPSVKGNEVKITPEFKILDGSVKGGSTFVQARGALTLLSKLMGAGCDGAVVLTTNGQVAGIARYAGLGRADLYPISLIRETIAGRVIEKNGNIPAGLLGAAGRAVNDSDLVLYGLTRKAGVVIREVMPSSPASISGIQLNDVIVGYDGKEIVTPSDLSTLISSSPAGYKMTIRAMRGGKPVEFNVVLGAKEISPPAYQMAILQQGPELDPTRDQMESRISELEIIVAESSRQPSTRESIQARRDMQSELLQLKNRLRTINQYEMAANYSDNPESIDVRFRAGFYGRELAPQLRAYFGSGGGILVTKVEKGTIASEYGLQAGDVITETGSGKILNLSSLKSTIDHGGRVVLRLIRRGVSMTLTINQSAN